MSAPSCLYPCRQTEQDTGQIVRTGDELERTQRRVGTVGRIGAVGRVAPPGVGLAVDDREAVGRDVEPPKLIDVRDIRPLGDGEVLAGRVGLSTAVRIAAAICARERGRLTSVQVSSAYSLVRRLETRRGVDALGGGVCQARIRMRSSLRVIGGGDYAYRKEAPLGADLELPEAPGLGEVRLLVVRLVGERPEALSEVICLSRRRHTVPRYERSLT